MLCVMAVMMVACHKEGLETKDQDGTQIMLAVRDSAWQDSDTRTLIGVDKKIYLSGDEKMAVFYKTGDQYSKAIQATPSGDLGNYTFTAPSGTASNMWYAIMPYGTAFIAGASSNTGHSLFLSPVQQPTQESFDPRFDFMTAKPFTIGNDNTATVQGFKRYFSVLRVDVKNLAEGDRIHAATLTIGNTAKGENAVAALTGLSYVKMSESIGEVKVTSFLKDACGNSVTAVFGDEGLGSVNGVWPLWFVVNPVTLKVGDITLTVTTSGKTLSKTARIPADKILSSTRTASMGFSMNGATVLESKPWLERGTSLVVPQLAGTKVIGLRIYADAENKCKANEKETVTLRDVEYDFNFCKGSNASSLAANGGYCEIYSSDGTSLSGETLVVTSGVKISKIILLTANDVDPSSAHPRLFVTTSELEALRAKVNTSPGREILDKLEHLSVPMTPEEESEYDKNAYRYYYQMRGDISAVQIKALNYMLHGNAVDARSAISTILALLKDTNFGTKNDMSRASGVRIMVGAMIYDWCYDELTDSEKHEFIAQFKRIAATMECGWPLKGVDYVCGHASEWMVLRDLLAAGIATRDEDSEIFDAVLDLIQTKYVPVRNYVYAGGAYHQGGSYVTARFGNDLTAMWMLSKIGMGNIFDSKIKDVAYEMIYRYRPDGQVLPNGDMNPNRRLNTRSYAWIGMLAGSYFHDQYLQWMYDLDPDIENHCVMLDLLWHDFNLQSRKPDSNLPLVRYFGTPYGWNIARTSWDDNAVIAEMKVGEKFFGNHQHADAGSFQIYYKEPLAIDSGAYQGTSEGGYSSEHCMNYFKRTIAHNSILVYNPSEVFASSNYGGAGVSSVANDGGQRLPNSWLTCPSYSDLLTSEYATGSVVSHWDDGYNVYLKGDITSAYSSNKVSAVKRSFVFLNNQDADCPATLFVYDYVNSRNASYKKYFLLHTIEEPTIGTNTYDISRTFSGRSGYLHCKALAPSDAVVGKVGGNGHEFDVFGTNYPNEVSSDNAGEIGAWRVEVTAAAGRKEDKFLNVIEVASSSKSYINTAKLSYTDSFACASYRNNLVFFSKKSVLESTENSFTLSSATKVLITDLASGNWRIVSDEGYNTLFNVKAGENIISAQLPAGKYTMRKE